MTIIPMRLQNPDVVYDLRRFAEALPEAHRDLRKRIRQWNDAHSIATDLRLAHDSVQSAIRLNKTGRGSLDLAVMALMQSAVMAYSKALERHSDHRGTVAIKGRFSPEQSELHRRLCEIRDESLAHFGPAGTTLPWSEDHALLLQSGIHWQPVISSRRALFDAKFSADFLDHLKETEAMVMDDVAKRRVAFQNMFDDRLADDAVAQTLEASALSAEEIRRFQPVFDSPRKGRHIVTYFD